MTRDLALIAAFAAFVAVLGQLPAFQPFGIAVPITAQTLGVMLAGLCLGSRRGALAIVTFLVLVALGWHLLSGGRGGLGVFVGPSAGFILGWVPGAWFTGALAERQPARLARRARFAWFAGAAAAGGIGVVYLIGVPVMALRLGQSLGHALAVSAVFLPGDALKVAVAAVVAAGVHRGYPGLLPLGRTAEDARGR